MTTPAESDLSEHELRRLENIRRNEAFLSALGLNTIKVHDVDTDILTLGFYDLLSLPYILLSTGLYKRAISFFRESRNCKKKEEVCGFL